VKVGDLLLRTHHVEVEDVVSGAAGQHTGARPGPDDVVARPAVDRIGSIARDDQIVEPGGGVVVRAVSVRFSTLFANTVDDADEITVSIPWPEPSTTTSPDASTR